MSDLDAQRAANHESPRTTKLYDRTSDAISLDEIERILIFGVGPCWGFLNGVRRTGHNPLFTPHRGIRRNGFRLITRLDLIGRA